MKPLILAAVLILATGCATAAPARVDNISFDRGAFALIYADVSQLVKAACKKPGANAIECARMDEVDKSVRKQIVTPPAVAPSSAIDMEQIMKLIGMLGKLAL